MGATIKLATATTPNFTDVLQSCQNVIASSFGGRGERSRTVIESDISVGMSKAGKHHYIPIFYLKQWAGQDHMVCEYKRRYHGVLPRRVFPDATGYEHGLNRIPGLPPHEADFLETYFFGITDDFASKALHILLSGNETLNFSQDVKSGWSRFITSLMMRNPEAVERSMAAARALYERARSELEADYAQRRNPDDPPTYGEFAAQYSPNPAGRAGAILLQKVIDNPMIGSLINNMRWLVLKAHSPKFTLLTSDRPVLMTNGLKEENSQIIIPISPWHVFVATNNAKTERYVESVFARGQMIQQVNERVTLQSRKYVYGLDDSQLAFVSKRLGKAYTSNPLESIQIDIPEP